tara:strand:- start:370 stop:600 length:231 start_codon:yes stop_codon:yes gene_type:complete
MSGYSGYKVICHSRLEADVILYVMRRRERGAWHCEERVRTGKNKSQIAWGRMFSKKHLAINAFNSRLRRGARVYWW